MTARAAEFPEFARVMREGRTRRELRQHALAARLGFSPRQLSRWERGDSVPQSTRMDDFLERLGELDRAWADSAAIALRLRAAPAPAPPAARDVEALRRAAHEAFYAAAERANLPPASLRAAVDALLGALAAAGLDLAEARAFLREPPAS